MFILKRLREVLLPIACLVLCSDLFGQSFNSNQDISIIPPPPDVANLGKAGLSQVKLSDGSMTTQIPLYEYKTKNLSVPITLAYSTNGLKVDEISGIAGMNWSLVAGGSIGRMILGNDDYQVPFVQYPATFPNTQGDTIIGLVNSITANGVETIPDIYNLNVNGYSGRFLYVNSQIIKLEQNSLNIQKTTNGFSVTDNNGVVYTFEKQEKSQSFSSCSGHPYSVPVTNAWLLASMSHPLGDVIYFNYTPCTYTYSTGLSQSYTENPVSSSSITFCPSACPLYPGTYSEKCVSDLTYSGYLLSSISSNQRGTVQFHYGARTDIPRDSLLNYIAVYDNISNPTIRTISFNYSTVSPNTMYSNTEVGRADTTRAFLNNVNICSRILSDTCLTYSFTYNNLGNLPQRLSYAQDHFGYFNGKNSNHSLIPSPANYGDLINNSNFSGYGYGDRSPNGQYSVTGTLSKIQYPTGGYDTVIYEPNTIHTSGWDCTNLNASFFVSGNATAAFHSVDSSLTSVNFHCPQTISISLNCNETVTGYPAGTYSAYVYFKSTGGGPTIYFDANGDQMVATPGNSGTYILNLNPGSYQMVVKAQGPDEALASFSYNDASDSGNLEQPGLRVQQILSYTSRNDSPIVKSYQYTNFNSTISSGVAYMPAPSYQNLIQNSVVCPDQSQAPNCTCAYMVQTCQYYTYSNSNFYNLYTYTGNNMYYGDVTELIGRQGANGAIEHKFLVGQDVNGTPILGAAFKGAPLSNFGIYNGFEYNTRYYKSVADAFVLERDVTKHMQDDPRLSSYYTYYAFKADPGFQYAMSGTTYNTLYQMPGLHVMQYQMLSRWLYADSVYTTDYFDNGSSAKTVQVQTYNNIIHQQVSQKTAINSKGQTLLDDYLYPPDSVSTTDAAALAAKYTLTSLHMYSPVLEERQYNGSSLLRTNERYYSNALGTSVPVMNRNYVTQSGTRDSTYAITGYGLLGDVTQAVKSGKDATAYLWDYANMYPVAQVLNANQSDVAYTSFEADGTGNWAIPDTTRNRTGSLTGNRSYRLTGSNSIVKSSLNSATTYIVGYWALNDSAVTINGSAGTKKVVLGNWTYREASITGITSLTVGGTGTIDELRLYPKGALMTTFTYAPLIGMTTQCDPSGKIAYYTYDGLGRLELIKDQYGNILKRYDYQYQTTNQ